MKILKEIAVFVHQFRRQKIAILNHPGKKKNLSKPEAFYLLLLDEKMEDENDLAKALGFEGKQTGNYRRLKSDVEKRMLNNVFFLDPKYFSKDKVVRLKCYKDLLILKIFLHDAKDHIVLRLAKRTLANAQKYDFEDIAMEVCYFMRRHYGLKEYRHRKFAFYNNLYHLYKEERDAKELADEYRIQLIHLYRQQASDEKIMALKDEFLDKVGWLLKKSLNLNLHLLAFYIQFKSFSFIYNYKMALKVLEDFIAFLKIKDHVRLNYLSLLYSQKLLTLVKLGRYKEGREAVKTEAQYFKKGTTNWYTQRTGAILLFLHSQDYKKAYQVYREVSKNNFKNASPRVKERWQLYRAYLQYLINRGKIVPDSADDTFDNFRLSKFLNEVPELSRDKSVHNIAILVIHFLLLIEQKKYHDALDRIGALEKYLVRYIKRKKDFRSNCFIKMLIKITDANFHPIRAKNHAKALLKQLKAEPLPKARQDYDVEIIPYEHLWEMALESLSSS